ncbi:MAG: hypothetical protein U5N86_04180 [Planctomycetota bacterium]|nr:hypothetical protein [Planctomycetota bacterium]
MTFILHFRRALIRFLALLALAASMSITTGCDDADSVEMVEVERGPIA